jgi:hypothetical protein
MRMSKRIKVCTTLEEALAAQEIGALLWRPPGASVWIKNPSGPYVKAGEEARKSVANGWYGYYVEDGEDE